MSNDTKISDEIQSLRHVLKNSISRYLRGSCATCVVANVCGKQKLYDQTEDLEDRITKLEAVAKAADDVNKCLNSDAIFEEMREVWGNTNTALWREQIQALGIALDAWRGK